MTTQLYVRRRTAFLSLLLALVAGGAIVLFAASTFGHRGGLVPVFVSSVSAQDAGSLTSGFAPIVRRARPAVVNVSTTHMTKVRNANPFFNDPIFRQFFGNNFPGMNGPRERKEENLGSGVIVSKDGYILTNNHVVDKATEIRVALSDHREFKGKVVGADPKSDIAVVKIDATDLPVLTFADSSKSEVGDLVLAIGNPFGIGQTVTMGIISATSRGGLGIEDYEDFIQTDAAINPGNSGGALINNRGELIGINTAILTGNGGGGNAGIGFAIPINMARLVMDQILKNGRVIRGYVGVGIQAVTPDIAKALGMKEAQGVVITSIEPDGPAANSGMKEGDVIVALNGELVEDLAAFRLKVSQTAPGTTVTLTVVRENGAKKDFALKLTELPSERAQRGSGEGGGVEGGAMQGVTVDRITPDIASRLGLPANVTGVVVASVDPNSLAADAGLQEGDVIQSVNRQRITNVSDYNRVVRQAAKNTILLRVLRGGQPLFLVIQTQ